MKKTLFGFITALLVATSLIFAGCEKEENFHSSTATLATEFVQTEKYEFLFNDNSHITYNTPIQLAIESGDEDYSNLNSFYESSLKNFTYMFTVFQPNLNLEPQTKTDKVKKAYKNLETNLASFKTALDNFLIEKDLFITQIGATPFTPASKAHLNNFKTKYKKIIYTAKNFYEAFKTVYVNGFLPYPSLETETLQPGTQKLVSTINVGILTAINMEYMFDGNMDIEFTQNHTTILDNANRIKTTFISTTKEEATITKENLKSFLETEKVFNTEVEHFRQALSNFDLKQYYLSTNKTEFLKEKNNQLYFNRINTFINSYSTLYTDNLISNLL